MRTDQLTTGVFRIYPPDAIPFWALSSKSAIRYIGKTFGFEQFQHAQPDDKNIPASLAFARGRAPATELSATATIESLVIGNGQLDLTTRDPAGHPFGQTVLLELGRVCAEVAPERPAWIETQRVEILQTIWVGKLDFDPEDLIDPRARGAILPALTRIGNDKGERLVRTRGLSFQIATRASRSDLVELGIQIPDDEFKLEPRAGRLPSERAWFSTSALRSEDHLKLLEAIEDAYRV